MTTGTGAIAIRRAAKRAACTPLPLAGMAPPSDDLLTWPLRVAKQRLVVHVAYRGDPISKQRARFAKNGNGSVYTPVETAAAEMGIRLAIRATHRRLLPDGEAAFGVRLLFFSKTRQRRDVDNMTKLVFDACTGLVWDDDSQVVELIARKMFDSRNPRTELAIYTLPGTAREDQECLTCGRRFYKPPSLSGSGFCSRRCNTLMDRSGINHPCLTCGELVYRTLAETNRRAGKGFYCSRACKQKAMTVTKTCPGCEREFLVPRSFANRKRFCSAECMAAAASRRRLLTRAGIGTCTDCGGTTSKKVYLRCNPCRGAKMAADRRAKPRPHLVGP